MLASEQMRGLYAGRLLSTLDFTMIYTGRLFIFKMLAVVVIEPCAVLILQTGYLIFMIIIARWVVRDAGPFIIGFYKPPESKRGLFSFLLDNVKLIVYT